MILKKLLVIGGTIYALKYGNQLYWKHQVHRTTLPAHAFVLPALQNIDFAARLKAEYKDIDFYPCTLSDITIGKFGIKSNIQYYGALVWMEELQKHPELRQKLKNRLINLGECEVIEVKVKVNGINALARVILLVKCKYATKALVNEYLNKYLGKSKNIIIGVVSSKDMIINYIPIATDHKDLHEKLAEKQKTSQLNYSAYNNEQSQGINITLTEN
eukprot:TRINITY_DN74684_c0_g1_i1.p1 TRINITY_DN74684_c0_g1~~TRINITY_DN74684_c0_g1_i1.p1  ORF type:complete len:244 (-),score=10.53 TRINITY_DN74684_c0_g1_i1:25-672(-)